MSAKRKAVFRAGLALLIFVSTLSAQKPDPAAPGPHEEFGGRAEIIIRDVHYIESRPGNKHLTLDIYSNPHDGLWPIAFVIHGGSFTGGDKCNDNKVYNSKVLADSGYVVFNVNYRLVPVVTIKEEVEDVMAAVIWAKEHAREYGGDPDRAGVMGGSAGGLLAALVAWASDDDYFEPTGVIGKEYDSDVKVAALYYPVVDLDRTLRDMTRGAAPFARAALTRSLGNPYRRKLEHLSPSNHVDASIPPTMFLTGDSDSVTFYPQSVEFEKKLKDLGIDTRLFTAEGKEHAFTWQYWEPESMASAQAVAEFFDLYLK